jgi:TPR repeat protein
MKLHRLLLMVISAYLAMASVSVMGDSDNSGWRDEATSLYASGDYKQAYKKYLKQGKNGDRFSQYRVSYMHLKGLGAKEDIIESLAWATLAAQNGQEDLSSYQKRVAALVPQDRRKKAQNKVDYYLRRWGEEQEKEPRRPKGDCTGSRLSANCSPTSSRSSMISWSRNPPETQVLMDQIEELNQSIEQSATHQKISTS